jgi:hypothetical protein
MTSDLELIHIGVETILAGLVWVLFRRAEAARCEIIAREAECGLIKKRFEAATAGLHFRLLHVERLWKQAAAWKAPIQSRREWPASPPPARAANGNPRGSAVARTQLSRGEMDLLLKVRQLHAS